MLVFYFTEITHQLTLSPPITFLPIFLLIAFISTLFFQKFLHWFFLPWFSLHWSMKYDTDLFLKWFLQWVFLTLIIPTLIISLFFFTVFATDSIFFHSLKDTLNLKSQARNKIFESFKSLKSSSGLGLCSRTVIRKLSHEKTSQDRNDNSGFELLEQSCDGAEPVRGRATGWPCTGKGQRLSLQAHWSQVWKSAAV